MFMIFTKSPQKSSLSLSQQPLCKLQDCFRIADYLLIPSTKNFHILETLNIHHLIRKSQNNSSPKRRAPTNRSYVLVRMISLRKIFSEGKFVRGKRRKFKFFFSLVDRGGARRREMALDQIEGKFDEIFQRNFLFV
jgi:hypothetical protein